MNKPQFWKKVYRPSARAMAANPCAKVPKEPTVATHGLNAIKDRFELKDYDQDILTEMPTTELRKNFGNANNSGWQIQKLFRNIIWQLHTQALGPNPPEFVRTKGNVRSMWYFIKTRIRRVKSLRANRYTTMIAELSHMAKVGLLEYADFQFTDKDKSLRILGRENPHVLVFVEKDSFANFTEAISRIYSCTTVTLGGSPSRMSSSYLVREMAAAGIDLDQELYFFSLVDFDPRGEDAATDFIDQLKASGLKRLHKFQQYDGEYERFDLIQPANLTGDDVAIIGFKYELPKSEAKAQLGKCWAFRTGGVDGDGSAKWGLEMNEFSRERMFELVAKAVTPYLRTPAEVVQRRFEIRRLHDSVNDYFVYRATGTLPDPDAGHYGG